MHDAFLPSAPTRLFCFVFFVFVFFFKLTLSFGLQNRPKDSKWAMIHSKRFHRFIAEGNVVYPLEQSCPWRLVNILFDESGLGLLGDVVSTLGVFT